MLSAPVWVRPILNRDLIALDSCITIEGVNNFEPYDYGLWTPLQYACRCGFTEGVCLLLQRGANPDLCTKEGQCALHVAALNYRGLECVRALLDAGASVDGVRELRSTPIVCAVGSANDRAALLLLDHGAKITPLVPAFGYVPGFLSSAARGREKCRRTALVLLGIRRMHKSALLSINALDVIRVIAKHVWSSRLNEAWTYEVRNLEASSFWKVVGALMKMVSE